MRIFEKIALGVTAIGSVAGLAGSYVILPYRVEAVEKEQTQIKREISHDQMSELSDHELLVRIDERLQLMQKILGEINSEK